jgi:hypothetical protein
VTSSAGNLTDRVNPRLAARKTKKRRGSDFSAAIAFSPEAHRRSRGTFGSCTSSQTFGVQFSHAIFLAFVSYFIIFPLLFQSFSKSSPIPVTS